MIGFAYLHSNQSLLMRQSIQSKNWTQKKNIKLPPAIFPDSERLKVWTPNPLYDASDCIEMTHIYSKLEVLKITEQPKSSYTRFRLNTQTTIHHRSHGARCSTTAAHRFWMSSTMENRLTPLKCIANVITGNKRVVVCHNCVRYCYTSIDTHHHIHAHQGRLCGVRSGSAFNKSQSNTCDIYHSFCVGARLFIAVMRTAHTSIHG